MIIVMIVIIVIIPVLTTGSWLSEPPIVLYAATLQNGPGYLEHFDKRLNIGDRASAYKHPLPGSGSCCEWAGSGIDGVSGI